MIEQQLADLTAAVKELTQAMIASKSCATSVVLSSATESPKDDGGTAAKTTKAAEKPAPKVTNKAAEKPAPKVTNKAAEKPAPKVSESAYTDDDIRAIAKGYLGIDDLKLREQRKEWIVGLIGELGSTNAVGISAANRPAFDAWVQEATRTGDCPDYEAYVDGSYLDAGESEESEDEV
jgi:hypothetical protein